MFGPEEIFNVLFNLINYINGHSLNTKHLDIMTKFEAYYEGNNGSKRETVYSSALKVWRGTLSAENEWEYFI